MQKPKYEVGNRVQYSMDYFRLENGEILRVDNGLFGVQYLILESDSAFKLVHWMSEKKIIRLWIP